MELTSPIAGTVLAVNNSVGDTVGVNSTVSASNSSGSGGSNSNLGTTIFQIGSLNQEEVQISVNQLDATNVHVGQPATVTIDALPGRTFQGSVAIVTPQAVSSSGVITFPVTIAINTPSPLLQPGMTATANIITFQKQGTLTVPRAVVTTKNGASTVEVPGANGKLTSQKVTTGVSDTSNIEITGGLKAGDKVARMTPKRTGSTGTGSSTPTNPTAPRPVGGGGGGVFIGGGGGAP